MRQAQELEPLGRLRTYLINIGAWSDAQEEGLREECVNDIDAAVEAYINRRPQPVTDMFDYLFDEPTDRLRQQRALAQRYEASKPNDRG